MNRNLNFLQGLLLLAFSSLVSAHGDDSDNNVAHLADDNNSPVASPGVAIGLTFIVTASTILGSSLPLLILASNKKINKMVLAAAFAFAAGAIVFGGLVDLLGESMEYFRKDSHVGARFASISAMAAFFLGVLVFVAMERVIKYFAPDLDCPCHGVNTKSESEDSTKNEISLELTNKCDCENPSQEGEHSCGPMTCEINSSSPAGSVKSISWLAFIAMTVHHIPEGMIFYLSVTSDYRAGAIVGLLLLVHVLPEGLSIGFPTIVAYPDQKWRCVLYGAIAGLAYPLGALLAFAIMQGKPAYGSGFGIISAMTAGFLVTIAMKGLLPYARSIDVKDKLTTPFAFLGMFVIFLSIVLFDLFD